MVEPLLEVKNLHTRFNTDEGTALAVKGLDLTIQEGETFGLVGESGCGKSVTALSVIRLIPDPPGRILKGRVLFRGQDLLRLSEAKMRRIRGRSISMIFQEPMTSLNPVFTIGAQMTEIIRIHRGVSKAEAKETALEMLIKVGIPDPSRKFGEYPHQISGGMRQRVMIAMALSSRPSLLIADEPTTALDVTIQAQILDLLIELKEEMGAAVLLITHDLGVIAEMASRVAVMYTGQVVEEAKVKALFRNPFHPYTQGLMASIPSITKPIQKDKHLEVIPGLVPSLFHLPEGCTFRERCPRALKKCREEPPPLIRIQEGHGVRCWLYE
ncbi:MAG: ABC transporter ATP-binding protein [Deltaproteobacteria bacterium]|nr:ABC transporter ATP-binding protein [Deltaproteobacteria bacterium]MBW2303726.1 ABC transporter ATP-binding protein [Deltaproteobacteria bacterium]